MTGHKVSLFSELAPLEIHALYALRAEVFVVEQQCVYQDPDEKDPVSYHVLMFEEGALVGCSRLVPGVDGNPPSIGRVAVKKDFRSRGYGRELMIISLDKALYLFNTEQIVISAQSYLLRFYTNLGFVATGKEYLEDGIPHTKMVYTYGKI